MDIISTSKAPAAIGPYSQAIKAGGFLFASGQLGLDPASGTLAEGVEAQTVQAMANVTALLQAAGLSLDDVVKTTCYLKDMKDFPTFNATYGKYFSTAPARSCVKVGALPKGGLVEVEVIAALH